MSARGATARVAGAAEGLFQCSERVFEPGLANLFQVVVVIGSAAHPIKILRNNGMISIWQLEPIERLVAVVTGSCCHSQPYEVSIGSTRWLHDRRQITNNHIRAWDKGRRFCSG